MPLLRTHKRFDETTFFRYTVNWFSRKTEKGRSVFLEQCCITRTSSIKAKDGVFSVMGNHDYDMYLPFDSEAEKKADIEQIKSAERSYGWTLLLNENRVIRRGNDSIAIIGSENDGLPPWPALGDLSKATKGLKNLSYKLNLGSIKLGIITIS